MRLVLQRKLSLRPDCDPGLRIRRSARLEQHRKSRCKTRVLTRMVRHCQFASEVQWQAAGREDELDCVVSLDQRAGSNSRGHVQRLGRTGGALSEHLPAPAYPRNRIPSLPHGCGGGCTQSSGPGLRSSDGSGRPHPLPGAIGAHGARRRGFYILGVGRQTSDIRAL